MKSSNSSEPARVHYCDIGDYLTREEKLQRLVDDGSLERTAFTEITPNEQGDWINQRDERFTTYQAIGGGGASREGAMFHLHSRGLATSRDAWCYNYSRSAVESNMARMIANYNRFVAGDASVDSATQINWNRSLRSDARRQRLHEYRQDAVRLGSYRPFTRQWVYFDRPMNDMIYQLPDSGRLRLTITPRSTK